MRSSRPEMFRKKSVLRYSGTDVFLWKNIPGKVQTLKTVVPPQTQDVNWSYIRRSEDVLNVFWMFYERSVYVLCLRGRVFCLSKKFRLTIIKSYSVRYFSRFIEGNQKNPISPANRILYCFLTLRFSWGLSKDRDKSRVF